MSTASAQRPVSNRPSATLHSRNTPTVRHIPSLRATSAPSRPLAIAPSVSPHIKRAAPRFAYAPQSASGSLTSLAIANASSRRAMPASHSPRFDNATPLVFFARPSISRAPACDSRVDRLARNLDRLSRASGGQPGSRHTAPGLLRADRMLVHARRACALPRTERCRPRGRRRATRRRASRARIDAARTRSRRRSSSRRIASRPKSTARRYSPARSSVTHAAKRSSTSTTPAGRSAGATTSQSSIARSYW